MTKVELALVLDNLGLGAESEMLLDDFLVVFGDGEQISEGDLKEAYDFAATCGCSLEYDEFGHFDPVFRRIRPVDPEQPM